MMKLLLALILTLGFGATSYAAAPTVLGTWQAGVSFGEWLVDEIVAVRSSRMDVTIVCRRDGAAGQMRLSLPITIGSNVIDILRGAEQSVYVAGKECSVNQAAGPVSYRLQGNQMTMSSSLGRAVYRRVQGR